ncbi:MAG TPA: PilN domain-containing protein [Burkholderiaceae bacterium]|nr:PilN domain-containing protein [Burkholderiaceae bacterium]
MNTRINLLPHREMRRERRKKDFVGLMALTGILAAGAAFAVALVIDQRIDSQRARNEFIRAENVKLDEQIKEIATLRAEIDALRARQEAVETLQANRTIPVHLFDELVTQLPEGSFLKNLKQDERKVTLVGLAQSNERISDLLRALANDSPWLERPELVEIKAVPLANQQAGKPDPRGQAEVRRVYEFSMNALVKGRVEPETGTGSGATRQAGGGKPAVVATAARN